MAKKFVIALLLMILPVMIFAGYDENIAAGLAAYRRNSLTEAYKYYYAAYKEKPSPKLKQVLQFINKKYRAGVSAVKPAKNQDNPWKWALLGADAAALGFTVYAGVDYFAQADKYDKLYAERDNTTIENYDLLVREDKIFYDKQGVYTAGIVITTLAVAYTLADYFFVHAFFPVTAAAAFDPQKGEIKFALNCRY